MIVEAIFVLLVTTVLALLSKLVSLQGDVNQSQMRVNEVVKERIDAMEKREATLFEANHQHMLRIRALEKRNADK